MSPKPLKSRPSSSSPLPPPLQPMPRIALWRAAALAAGLLLGPPAAAGGFTGNATQTKCLTSCAQGGRASGGMGLASECATGRERSGPGWKDDVQRVRCSDGCGIPAVLWHCRGAFGFENVFLGKMKGSAFVTVSN